MKRNFKIFVSLLLTLGTVLGAASCGLLPDAVTIVSIEKTATEGLVDTYTITYSDGTESTFEVTNGKDGENGKDGADGTDGTNGIDGKDGQDGALTVDDLYQKYLEETGDAISYAEFLELYLNVEETEYSAVHESLLSTAKVYTAFTELENNVETPKMYTGAAVVYQMDSEYTYFLTNYHVVYDKDEVGENKISDEIHCYLYGSESKPTQTDGGFTYDEYAIACEYIGGSISYDLALVRAQTSAVKAVNESVQAVTLADTYYVGETAVAIGNPRGYCISVTKGTVSVDSEKMTLSGIDGTSRTYRAMRMDTPIYGGNSGGGLFNARGELIGLVNAKSTEDNNICFAIPLPIVKAVAHNLLANQDEKGVRAITLGIEYAAKDSKYTYDAVSGFGTITEDTLVVSVTEGSIAEQLGLQANDTIKAIAFGGETYPLTRSFQLSEYKLYLGTGTAFTLTYERDGEEATTQAYTVQDGDLETIE